jgi:hypothetical protein
MTTFVPCLVKGASIVIEAETSTVLPMIPLQFNSNILTCSLHIKEVSAEAGDRRETQRLIYSTVETLKLLPLMR